MVNLVQHNNTSYIVCACGRHFVNDDAGYRFHAENCEPSQARAALIRSSLAAEGHQAVLKRRVDAKLTGK